MVNKTVLYMKIMSRSTLAEACDLKDSWKDGRNDSKIRRRLIEKYATIDELKEYDKNSKTI